MLNANESIAQCLIAAHLDMHTRFPVTNEPGNPQAIIGYVNFKDIVVQMRLSPDDTSLAGIIRMLPSLPADLPIYVDDKLMQREWVILGSGSRSSKIKIAPEIFRRIPNATIVPDLAH